ADAQAAQVLGQLSQERGGGRDGRHRRTRGCLECLEAGAAQYEAAAELGLDGQRLSYVVLVDVDHRALLVRVQLAQVLRREDLDVADTTDDLLVGAGPEVLVEERRGRLAAAGADRDGEPARTFGAHPL